MNILVTGGAGYIGSHVVRRLLEASHRPVVFDNLSGGNEWALETKSVIGDLRDGPAVEGALVEHEIEAVMHLAALACVGESFGRPGEYFDNNVGGLVSLLDACARQRVHRLVFSSSCAVYGDPVSSPMTEDHPLEPMNPYGESKLMCERALRWFGEAYGLSSVALRYFNVAGCDPGGGIGELHRPETHLIPNILLTALGRRDVLIINGDDYDTPDGTCMRDFVHVMDIADAHLKALDFLGNNDGAWSFNLGSARGYSVREITGICRGLTGREIKTVIEERRPGDPGSLVADSGRATRELGWEPAYGTIEAMVETHWKWLLEAQTRGLL